MGNTSCAKIELSWFVYCTWSIVLTAAISKMNTKTQHPDLFMIFFVNKCGHFSKLNFSHQRTIYYISGGWKIEILG